MDASKESASQSFLLGHSNDQDQGQSQMDASKESASQSFLLGHSNDKHQNDLNIKLFDVQHSSDKY